MIEPLLRSLPQPLLAFAPFPSGADRGAWESLPGPVRERLITRGEQAQALPITPITATDFMTFALTGDRVNYENKYFPRRRALCALILAECAEYKGRFVGAIADWITALCEESAWQLPAHNTYRRDATPLPLPDPSRPLLDLFACETSALLCCAHYLLAERLDRLSPLLTRRIAHEVRLRILSPYLNGWFWWMGGKGEATNNWTVWCTQNVLLSFFLLPCPQDERRRALIKAAASLDAFLADYGEDGCCDEGAQYYRHAALCLFGALDVMDRVCGGHFAPIWQQPKIRNIAHYIVNVHVQGPYYINFADCSPIAGHAGVREYLFGKRIGDLQLCDFATQGWRQEQQKDLPDEINLYYRAQAAFAHAEIDARQAGPIPHQPVYYPSTGLFIARDNTYCLAVKAGDNNDSHNHNDTGSVTLYKNGQPLLIDVGVESYTAKTFSSRRYEIWTMQSSWHNLPDFDGVMQSAGPEFRATDVKTVFDPSVSSIQMRLENAWPQQARLAYYTRYAALHKRGHVVITDRCKGDYRHAVMNLMFCREPALDKRSIRLPALACLQVEGGGDMTVEAVPITDARLAAAWPDTIYRVRIPFEGTLTLIID